MSQFNMPPGVSVRDIPTGDECEGCSDRDEVIAELLEALDRSRNWHLGDKWRDGGTKERQIWESHLDKIEAAIEKGRGYL